MLSKFAQQFAAVAKDAVSSPVQKIDAIEAFERSVMPREHRVGEIQPNLELYEAATAYPEWMNAPFKMRT